MKKAFSDQDILNQVLDNVSGDISIKYDIPPSILETMTGKSLLYNGGFVAGFTLGMTHMAELVKHDILAGRETMKNANPIEEISEIIASDGSDVG